MSRRGNQPVNQRNRNQQQHRVEMCSVTMPNNSKDKITRPVRNYFKLKRPKRCNWNKYQSNGKQRQKRPRMSTVTMPNYAKDKVTIPAIWCDCIGLHTFNARFTKLKPDGKMGGREFRMIQHQMNNTIKQHENPEDRGGVFSKFEVVELIKIQNPCLWRKFREKETEIFNKKGFVNEKLLFHGTTAAETIAQYGFDLNASDDDNMFGRAVYFARNSSKSNQYVYGHMNEKGCPYHASKSCYSCTRQMLLCRVALGCMRVLTEAEPMMDRLPEGFHSVVGKPDPEGDLKFYEYAVYNPDQVYPEYLITYKLVP